MMLGSFMDSFNSGLDAQQRRQQQAIAAQKSLLELQQQQRELAARAAAFGRGGVTGLPGGQGMPQPPPGMNRGMMGNAMNWLGRQFGSDGMQSPQAGGMGQGGQGPAPGGMPAPAIPGVDASQIPTGPIGPFQGGGGGGMPKLVGNQAGTDSEGGDEFSIAGMNRQLQAIADDIKIRNPGIDDETLAEAVSQRVNYLSKVGALSSPMERYYATLATQAGQDRRTDRTNDTRRDIAGQNNQTRSDIATANRQERGREVDARIGEQKWSAELSNEWHIRGQNMTHDDRQAAITAGITRTQYVQDSINERFQKGQLDKYQWQEASNAVKGLTAKMNAAQRIMNGIVNSKPDADPSTDPQYKSASADYEAAASKLDFIEQTLDQQAPVDKSKSGGPAGGNTPNPAPKQGKPGSSRDNPIKPASLEEARKLAKGTWVQDPSGKIAQIP